MVLHGVKIMDLIDLHPLLELTLLNASTFTPMSNAFFSERTTSISCSCHEKKNNIKANLNL